MRREDFKGFERVITSDGCVHIVVEGSGNSLFAIDESKCFIELEFKGGVLELTSIDETCSIERVTERPENLIDLLDFEIVPEKTLFEHKKEMTLAEVESELGYAVKVISDEV